MKRIIVITVLFTFVALNAQTYQTTEPIEEKGESEYGVYYKDINNVFDDFEGIYVYNDNGIYLKFVLQKKVLSNSSNYYWQDMLIGGYQYKLNNTTIVDCLNDVNVPITDGRKSKLKFSSIWEPEDNAFCDDCLSAKWLWGFITDPISDRSAQVYMARKLHNGQEALYVWLYLYGTTLPGNGLEQPINLPTGQKFTMIKVD